MGCINGILVNEELFLLLLLFVFLHSPTFEEVAPGVLEEDI